MVSLNASENHGVKAPNTELERRNSAWFPAFRLIGAPLWIGILTTASIIVACGRPPSQGEMKQAASVRDRFIEEESGGILEPLELSLTSPAFDWAAGELPPSVDWLPFKSDAKLVSTLNGIAPESAGQDLDVVAKVALDARQVGYMDVRVEGLERGSLLLFWAAPGQSFTPERKMSRRAQGPGPQTYRFELAGHPEWIGKIGRVRIATRSAATGSPSLEAARTGRLESSLELLEAYTEHPWKADLGGEVRNALVCPPGTAISRAVLLQGALFLRFGIGLLPGSSSPVRFVVTAHAAGGFSERLFEESLRPQENHSWEDREIDLQSIDGTEVTLEFTTETTEESPSFASVPLWSNPEVLTRADQERPPNIILISIDTLRSDHMSLYGYDRRTSPRIDAWAVDRGITFLETVASAPWTLPSHVSMFTGLDSLTHGVNRSHAAPDELVTLAEFLRRRGYSTAAFTAGAYMGKEFGLGQGFDILNVRRDKPDVQGSKDEIALGVQQVSHWLETSRAEPFFLLFHTYEVHSPYWAREGYFEDFGGHRDRVPRGYLTTAPDPSRGGPTDHSGRRFLVPFPDGKQEILQYSGSDRELIEAVYDSGIAYMDFHVGELLSAIASHGLDSRSIVVLTSDHGEALGEHGLAGHGFLFDDNLLVPLVIALPTGRHAGRRIHRQVRLIDLYPTLIDLAGYEVPAGIDGVSLAGLIADDGAQIPGLAWSYAGSTNWGVSVRQEGAWKYMVRNAAWKQYLGRELYFDLRSDPAESNNLADSATEVGRLRQITQSELGAKSTGLEVVLQNHFGSTLTGTIQSPLLRGSSVTSLDLDCPCLDWIEAGEAAIRLPADQTMSIYLEPIDRLDLESDFQMEILGFPGETRRRPMEFETSLSDLSGANCWSLTESGWLDQCSGDQDSQAVLQLRWTGQRQPTVEDEPSLGREALEQLRALGYIE